MKDLYANILNWLCIYLLFTGVYSVIFTITVTLYIFFPSHLLQTVIDVVGFGVPILFMCIGIVSLLPLSEYRYAKQGGVNPAIAREIVQHTRRKPERKEFGILMGIAGLAIVFRFDPWLALFFLVSPYLGLPITTILITIILLVSIALRNRKLEMIRK